MQGEGETEGQGRAQRGKDTDLEAETQAGAHAHRLPAEDWKCLTHQDHLPGTQALLLSGMEAAGASGLAASPPAERMETSFAGCRARVPFPDVG